jgi:hypothetical protein
VSADFTGGQAGSVSAARIAANKPMRPLIQALARWLLMVLTAVRTPLYILCVTVCVPLNMSYWVRGSSAFHAWGDSNLYLRRDSYDHIVLTVEHRAAAMTAAGLVAKSADGDCLAGR